MSNCGTCGRAGGGHWIGCTKSASVPADFWANVAELPDAEKTVDGVAAPVCAYGNCEEPRRSEDKRVKFCETHSDPKNRK